MKSAHFFPAGGGWYYLVRVGTRIVVVGWSMTREQAEREATMA